jgi:pre-mRNA-processing factor SLU7
MASGATWKSRDDWKKEKELQEARKAGTAAPELDEEGKMINPHIPQYIAQAPWYLDNTKPGLKHQRRQTETKSTSYDAAWYIRGAKLETAKKYRKGACTNCGAMTHTAKACVERPRKVGARWNSADIKADEIIQDVSLDFEGKRDRWNGYDPNTHKKLLDAYEQVDEERRKAKAEQISKGLLSTNGEGQTNGEKEGQSDSDNDHDMNEDFKEKEDYNAPVTKADPRTRTTIRNLRIREDKAKYLMNLDLDSAYYDPKTRSMRENPTPNARPDDQIFIGDNFIRNTGDSQGFNNMQNFAWEAYEKGQEIHPQGAPSQAALLHEQYKAKKETLKAKQQATLLQTYGGEEHINSIPKELIYAQTEQYVEYARDGTQLRKQSKLVAKSKYEEDVFTNNHTSVWGSYWDAGEWGYACCHQLVKNSYCTGEAGKQARVQTIQSRGETPVPSMPDRNVNGRKRSSPEQSDEEDGREEERGDGSEEDADTARNRRFQAALKAEEKRQKNRGKPEDERSRPYNSMKADFKEPSEEELMAYRMKRIRSDDPMKDFIGKDDPDGDAS